MLFAVAPHEKEHWDKVLRIPIDGSHDLQAWWIGELPRDHAGVAGTLGRMRADGMWVGCGCQGNGRPAPLFTLALKKDTDSVYMRRLVDREQHQPWCVFRHEMREGQRGSERLADKADKDSSRQVLDAKKASDEHSKLKIETALPEFLNEQKASNNVTKDWFGGRNDMRAPLERNLRWLMHESGMQTWPLGKGTPAAMLLRTADKIELVGGLKLSDVLYCRVQAWWGGWMEKAFEKCRQAGLQEQAFLICPVDAASKEGWIQMHGSKERIAVRGYLGISGENGPDASPMVMYAKIEKNIEWGVHIESAYVHPVYSQKHWMLIENVQERVVLADLHKACCYLMFKQQVNCTIKKPVPGSDWRATGVAPDFVLKAVNGNKEARMLIQAYASTEPAYMQIKRSVSHALLGHKVYEDMRLPGQVGANSRLIRNVLGYVCDTVLPKDGRGPAKADGETDMPAQSKIDPGETYGQQA